jgi:hypothetical protein
MVWLTFLLGILLFFALMGIVMILKIGGKTFRQIVKSKLPGATKRGMWRIHCSYDRKVHFVFQKIPPNEEVKIKSGDKPHLDEYAKISEIYHQHDPDGTPVIMTMDDLPFSFFLKKHFLDKWYPKLDEMIGLCYNVVRNKMHDDAAEVKMLVQHFVQSIRPELRHIDGASDTINQILHLDKDPVYRNKSPIVLLVQYHNNLLKIKELMLQKNRQFVNVYDLFKTTGYLKALKNAIFESWQNGFLAAQQAQGESKSNKILLFILIGVGLISLVGAFFAFQMHSTIGDMEQVITSNAREIRSLKDMLSPVDAPSIPLEPGIQPGGASANG